MTGPIADRRDRHGQIDQPAVLALAYGFEVIDALAGFHLADDDVFFERPIVGNDQCNASPHGLVCCESEDAFGRLVPGRDDAVEILPDDRVVGGINDRGEVSGGTLGLLRRCQIARHLRCANDLPRVATDRRHRHGQVDQVSVLALPHGLEMVQLLAGADLADNEILFIEAVAWNDQADMPADGLLGREAENAFGRFVPGGDDAFQRFADDRIVRRLDNRGQPCLRDERRIGIYKISHFKARVKHCA